MRLYATLSDKTDKQYTSGEGQFIHGFEVHFTAQFVCNCQELNKKELNFKFLLPNDI